MFKRCCRQRGQPIADGDPSPAAPRSGSSSPSVGTATLTAVAQAEVPTGNVYLYAGLGVNSAQKLILAQTATVRTTVSAEAEFQAFGKLEVDKTIAGDAAG